MKKPGYISQPNGDVVIAGWDYNEHGMWMFFKKECFQCFQCFHYIYLQFY
jgi:hypothetical protein